MENEEGREQYRFNVGLGGVNSLRDVLLEEGYSLRTLEGVKFPHKIMGRNSYPLGDFNGAGRGEVYGGPELKEREILRRIVEKLSLE